MTLFKQFSGKMSVFGGPEDLGVKPDEGLALLSESDLDRPQFNGVFLA